MVWQAVILGATGIMLNLYMGPTRPVYVFPKSGAVQHCFEDMSLSMHTGKIACKCDDVAVPVIELHTSKNIMYASVVVAENGGYLEAPLNRTCTCEDPEKNGVIGPVVLLPVNNDFFILNTREGLKSPNFVFAKQKPTPEILDNLVKTSDVLKERPGEVICTTETAPTDDENNTSTQNDLKQYFQANKE